MSATLQRLAADVLRFTGAIICSDIDILSLGFAHKKCCDYNCQMYFHKIINKCLKYEHSILTSNCLLCSVCVNNNQLSICDRCISDLPWQNTECCPQCGITSMGRQLCGHCLKAAPAF